MLLAYFLSSLAVSGFAQSPLVVAPVAKVVPHPLKSHGDVRNDPYYWLRDRNDPDVISYLKAWNGYTDQVMKSTEALQKQLRSELRLRLKEDDTSYPEKEGGYSYFVRLKA